MTTLLHPHAALFSHEAPRPTLPVVDHYCGVEARMRKSLALQAELGPVFDITLDAEDGAPVGGEAEHALLIAELAASAANRFGRVGARAHPWGHPAFEADVDTLIAKAGSRLAYLMIPKPDGADDVERAVAAIDAACERHGQPKLPLQVLIETHGALRDVFRIAAHPRIESLSFGLMDFVSAHGGAIPKTAMELPGQFEHPLVVRAKLEIAAAAHAYGKTPSHCVVTEFRDAERLSAAARRAAREFGYTRMWSIHPDQIRPIIEAFAPAADEIVEAADLLLAAQAAHWAPTSFRDRLHDRASYRYFWTVLERAQRTGRELPADARRAFFPASIG
ncbi:aldolase/citrate lyase family protein [Roseateles asaccharophilus]|uniref:Citrate lyase subunit beta/citryl-CoA lyase n=1 Tax=Roseateles asaccharophilus TaxID=582607 RepID=A0ABU2ADC5_9BURK|nr:aldolase/citrate lyase family protein [Roseateles asaccharophilus]MDR7334008.1 citrate lyase subunit beta/citryl-CoA lyase [Roseateles asaccharophilus]